MKKVLALCTLLAGCDRTAPPSAEDLALADSIMVPASSAGARLFERKDHGTVTGADGMAYTVCSGRYCDECDADPGLYVFPMNDGLPPTENNANSRMFPGTLRDGETGRVYYEARAFFGEVLQGVPGVIWFESALGTNDSLEHHTVLLDLTQGMQDQQQPGHDLLERTLALASAGKCQEITGAERTSAP